MDSVTPALAWGNVANFIVQHPKVILAAAELAVSTVKSVAATAQIVSDTLKVIATDINRGLKEVLGTFGPPNRGGIGSLRAAPVYQTLKA